MTAFDASAAARLLHTREAGDGPLLLCLHGIGSSSASFAPQLTAFADRYHVVAWDAPGYAASPALPSAPGMDGYADLAAVLIASHGAPAVVLGMSWGGVIAMRLAQRHPSLVRALILGDSTRGSAATPEKAAAMRARGPELSSTGPETFSAVRAPRLLRATAPAAEVEAAAKAMAAAIRLPGYAHAADSMAATYLEGSMGDITAHALVLYGEHDRVTGRPESEAIAAQIPGAALAVVPDAGHLANQENPEAFNKELSAFLSTL
ncbi:pimeloyl-ACP methyl ester carboxylesterase [Actinocorallia herbida]|uniref:Pimeloyl-ACP methyl ester carboxylesterase n=1 Tax=Actinocorallia herbida TaxID=58109 RepID=A0A3N1D7H2_9ACTN|nr:alpha/beta fold hydrolase [Actinocorallia herbida]ROO89068.1 pimeloyl-ACP methyl ester carboxylesterase [Actinocorallia herbida]